jgi:hypothetical protein
MITGWATRGPYLPPGHGSILATFLHSLVWSLGWHAGADIARAIGANLLVLLVIAAVVVWLVRRVRARTRPTLGARQPNRDRQETP